MPLPGVDDKATPQLPAYTNRLNYGTTRLLLLLPVIIKSMLSLLPRFPAEFSASYPSSAPDIFPPSPPPSSSSSSRTILTMARYLASGSRGWHRRQGEKRMNGSHVHTLAAFISLPCIRTSRESACYCADDQPPPMRCGFCRPGTPLSFSGLLNLSLPLIISLSLTFDLMPYHFRLVYDSNTHTSEHL